MTTTVRLKVNGAERELTVDNRTSLLDMLREHTELTGTKKGCDQGASGSRTESSPAPCWKFDYSTPF